MHYSCVRISKQAVQDFQALYEQECGKALSPEDAECRARYILNHNPRVGGSSPSTDTNLFNGLGVTRGLNFCFGFHFG